VSSAHTSRSTSASTSHRHQGQSDGRVKLKPQGEEDVAGQIHCRLQIFTQGGIENAIRPNPSRWLWWNTVDETFNSRLCHTSNVYSSSQQQVDIAGYNIKTTSIKLEPIFRIRVRVTKKNGKCSIEQNNEKCQQFSQSFGVAVLTHSVLIYTA
jgi:uncharacterized membrane protein